MEPYRVVLADDHMMFRLGMKKILEDIEDIKIVGEASDGYELLRLVKKIVPQMVIVDISMPKIRGIEATREIKNILPGIKIVIMTMHNNIEYLKHSIGAGADAFVLKQDAGIELFSAIEAVRAGSVYISPVFSVEMADDFVKKCRGSLAPESEDLTIRQREVIKLIAEGKTSKEVADLLFISTRTVEKHRAAIMAKLNLKTIPDIVKYAIRKEYISMDND